MTKPKPESIPSPAEIAEGIRNLNGTQRKYRNTHSVCNLGHLHPSKKEAERCQELQLLERAGQIQNLEYWPQYVFEHGGVRIGKYTADFRFCENGVTVVEDCKGGDATKTAAYGIRKRLMEAFFGIKVRET